MAKIQQSEDGTETELHIGGRFVASWRRIDIPEEARVVVCNMIEAAVRHGEALKAEEIRKVIGAK